VQNRAVRDSRVQFVFWAKHSAVENCHIRQQGETSQMNTKKWISMAAVVTLSATIAVAAPHEGGGKRGGRHGRGGEFGQRLAAKLNLTDAQQQQLRAQRESFKERNKAFFETTKVTREQFREARKANDTSRLEALKPTLQAQREQMKQLRQQQHEQFLAILTAEQRAQLESLKAQRGERRQRRMN
jgi:periplasmic protein CpxP/Spy